MDPQTLIAQLDRCQEFFDRSTSSLEEQDSGFRPTEEMHTSAQQVAHVAQIVDWFMQGAFRPEGFRMDWEAMEAELAEFQSLAASRKWVAQAFDDARAKLSGLSASELMQPIAEGEIMGGAPRMAAIGGIEDHTAHHRGALAVYARLCGHVPPMPYM